MGRHPGDLVSTISSSTFAASGPDQALLKDVIDQRLPLPRGKLAEGVVYIAEIAVACLNANPQYRPNMRQVSLGLLNMRPTLIKSFSEIELAEILVDHNVTGEG
uniref:non-specific serine/threonine protein kinase n=1 Tax=Rhizophora mucronata TaxID=61149 RepID=A0A2P2ME28_RHIMU